MRIWYRQIDDNNSIRSKNSSEIRVIHLIVLLVKHDFLQNNIIAHSIVVPLSALE